jgi:hypothetical protein
MTIQRRVYGEKVVTPVFIWGGATKQPPDPMLHEHSMDATILIQHTSDRATSGMIATRPSGGMADTRDLKSLGE